MFYEVGIPYTDGNLGIYVRGICEIIWFLRTGKIVVWNSKDFRFCISLSFIYVLSNN